MSLLLNYKNVVPNKNGANIIYLVDEKFNISSLKKYIINSHYSFLTDLLKMRDIKSEILNFEINSKKTIILVSLKKDLSKSGAEKLGAKLYSYIKQKIKSVFFIDTNPIPLNQRDLLGHFLHGIKLKSYTFEKYKSKKEKKKLLITVVGKNIPTNKDKIKFKALEEGTFFARDLVSEPGNILHPDEYAKRLKLLKKFGLKITIYYEKKT